MLTEALAQFACALQYEDLPEEARVAVKIGWTDCAITLLGGKDLPEMRIVEDTILPKGSEPEARLGFGSRKVSAPDAAFINAMAAHAQDMDDIALRGSHPSAVLVPAILSEAEALNASGKDLMTAYAAGFEVWAEAVFRDADPLVPKGWHLTAVIGGVATAAAVSNLKRVSPEVAHAAMSIASSCASGTVAGWGGDTKAFQVGNAARAGVMAVRLAEAGLKGGAEPLIGRGGLIPALSSKGNVDRDTPADGLGKVWQLTEKGIHTKMYPFVLRTHRVIEGTIEAVTEHDIAPEDIAAITLRIGPDQAKYSQAEAGAGFETELESAPRFTSLWLAVASAAVARRATMAELEPAFYEREDVQRIRRLIRFELDESIPKDPEPNLGFARSVEITKTDGSKVRAGDATYYPGHWTRRFSRDQHKAKFDFLAGDAAKALGLGGLFDRLQTLETLGSVNELYQTG
jgi:2-methylcitrate dehydratase PrpD